MVQNKGLIFKSLPDGPPKTPANIAVETRDFDAEAPAPSNGLIIKNLWASFDPYLRGKMRDPNVKSYTPAFTLGQPIDNHSISQVLKSSHPGFKEGDVIKGVLPIEEYSIVDEERLKRGNVAKVNNPHNLSPELFIGVLGMPGLTAYSSFYEIAKPKKNDTIFISSAAGAVGAIVGQLAKHEGLKVIGSVGDDAKLDYIIKELGFDGGWNYKKEKPEHALKRLAPDGLDVYYDNVGGIQLDAALAHMREFGRVVICGLISQYSLRSSERYGIKNFSSVLSKRLTVRGFIVSDQDLGPRWTKEHQETVGAWIADGSFKDKSSVTDGIDHAAEGLIGMLEGKNFGKALLKIA